MRTGLSPRKPALSSYILQALLPVVALLPKAMGPPPQASQPLAQPSDDPSLRTLPTRKLGPDAVTPKTTLWSAWIQQEKVKDNQ